MVETSNNNTKQPCGFTRARAHAPITRTCATLAHQTKSLILNAAVIVAVMLGIGAGNAVWGQTTLLEGTNYYSSGDYIVPEGFCITKIECIGGGGGGQAGPDSHYGGHGGGGGGYSMITPTNLTVGAVVTVVVGSGGAGGKSSSSINVGGEDGTPSYVLCNGTELLRAGGGKSGGNGGSGGTGTPYAGGTGGSVDYNYYGGGGGGGAAGPDGNGGDGKKSTYSGRTEYGGEGGTSGGGFAGDGGAGWTSNQENLPGGTGVLNGKEYGGGGGGGFHTSGNNYRRGGDGADGCVRITLSPISEMSQVDTDPDLDNNGNYTVPPGYYVYKLEAWGGGGGGQRAYSYTSGYTTYYSGGHGGGGGGYGSVEPCNIQNSTQYFIANGATLNVTKGSAGSGCAYNSSSNAGGNGGFSQVKSGDIILLKVNGGYGGGVSGNNNGVGGDAEYNSNNQNDAGLVVTHHKGGNGGSGYSSSSTSYSTYYRRAGGGGGAGGALGNTTQANGGNATSDYYNGGQGGTGISPSGNGGEGGDYNNADNSNAVPGGESFGGGGGGGYYGRYSNSIWGGGAGAAGGVYIHLKPIWIKVVLHGSTTDFTASESAEWSNLIEGKNYPVVYYQRFNTNPQLSAYLTVADTTITNSLTRSGYTFAGWSPVNINANNNNVIVSSDEINPTKFGDYIVWDNPNGPHSSGTLHLYAHWTPKEYHFYVNLDKNFSEVDDFVDTPSDDNENIPASGTTCGDKFTQGDNSRYYFVVKFDGQLNGEVTIQNDEVTTSCVEEIHRDGYLQDGWFWSYDATNRFDNQTLIDWTKTWDKTNFPDYDFDDNTFTDIYLKWKPDTFNVVLHANTYGSEGHFAADVDTIIRVAYNRPYGSTLGDVLPTTSESGYIFRGWSTVIDTTAETGVNVNADSIFKTHSTTSPAQQLYAKWERKIEFKVNSTDVLCHGGSTGEIHVTDIQLGNGSSYTVSISDGPTEKDPVVTTNGPADFTGLKAGTYTVTVMDHHGENEECIRIKQNITVGEPEALQVALVGHNPNCDNLNGSVEVKITGGVKPYKGTWNAANVDHTLDLTLTTSGDTAVFEQFVDAERTYTVLVTDKNGCPAQAETTLQPRANPFHFDYPVYKLNVCSGSKFSVNPTDFPLNPNDQPLHTTTETKNSAPVGTLYSWSVPTCSNSSLSVDDFNGEEGHSETDVNGRIYNTTGYPVTITYTVTPTNGYYCIGDPFTVAVEVNPGDNSNTVDLSQAKPIDTLCVGGGDVNVTVTNAAANSTLTWVMERGTVKDTVQVNTLTNPSSTETISYTVNGITGCSADSVYMVYYNDESGCTSELRKMVHLEIEKWNMDDYRDQANAKYISNAATVKCVTQVIRPTANMLPSLEGDKAVKAGCGLETDTLFISRSPEELNCDGTYIYTYHYKVKSCPSNYQVWTYTYTVNKENVSPTIELKSDELDTVNAIITTYCGYRIPKLTGSDTVKVSDAENCTSNPDVWQEPAALTLITDTTKVKVIVMDACGMSDTVIVTVTVPDSLKFPELTSTGVTCYGKGNGTIKPKTTTNTTATGGTPDYLYYIDGISTNTYDNLEFSSLSGGNHMVSVKDANGCEASTVVTVEEPSPLTATVSVTDVDCNGNSTGQITIVASGGTPGTDEEENHLYWYKLGASGAYPNDGRVDSVFKEKAAGTYKVYAKDDNGCEIDKTVTIGQPLRPLTLVVSPADAVCYGNTTSVFVSANGGNGGYEYKWYTTSVETPVSTSALYSIDPAPEETTTYNILVTDAKGCKETSSVEVTVNPLVQLEILSNQTQSVCLNQAIDPVKIRTNVPKDNLIANGLPMYVTVKVNETDTVISGKPVVAGTYQYTVWGISQYGCPPKTVSGSLVVHSAFTSGSITDGEHAICYGADLPAISSTEPALGGDGNMHYKWQYSTDNQATWNNIEDVDAADLAAESMPSGSNLQTTSFRRWAKNDCSAYVDDETFTVDEDGWVLSSGVYTIKVNELVAVTITGSDIVCIQGSLSGDVLELGMKLGGENETIDPEDYTYSWTLGDNEDGVPVGSSTGTTFKVSWTSPTTESNPKHVYLAVTETATTCVSRAEKTVTVNEPELKLNNVSLYNVTKEETSDGTICKDESVRLTANTTAVEDNTNYYTWKVGETVVKNASTEAFYVVTPTATTTYTVEVYAVKTVNNVSCTTAVQTREVTITVNDPQVTLNNINIYNHTNNNDVLLTSNTVCYGTTVKLEADATSNAPRTYSWKLNDQTEAVTDHPLIITLTENTTFHFSVTAHVGDCPKTVSKDTTVYVRQQFTPGTVNPENKSQEVCFGAEDSEVNAIAATQATGGETPIKYRWIHNYNNVNDTISDTTYNLVLVGYSAYAGTHTFTREAKDATCNDWTLSQGSYVLTVDPKFNAGAISTIGQTICVGGDVNLIGSNTDASGGRGDITYSWYHRLNQGEEELITGADSAKFDPSAYNQIPGEHYFTRKAANATCNSTAQSTGSYVLNVNPALELNIEGPTSICAGNSLDNNVLTLRETNGSTDSYTYLWTTGNNEGATISSGQNGTEVKVSWPNAGTGHITLTVRNNNTNCISESTVTVTVNATPNPSISGSESLCLNSNDFPTGGRFTATPANLSSYVWSADAGSTSVAIPGESANVDSVSWVSVGQHYVNVKVTDGNGCSAQISKEVMVNSLPILSVSTTSVSCHGGNNGTITATATNGSATYTYTYTLNDTSSNTTGLFEGLTASTAPHHTVVVTDPNGCKAKKTGIVIGQSADFTVVIDSIHFTSCAGNDGWIRARVLGSGMFDMGVYDQDDNLVGSYPAHHNAGETFEKTGLSYGVNYTLKVNAYGDQNCVDTKPFYMDKNDTLEIKSIPQPPTLCSGESNSFDVLPVVNITDGTRYSWAAPDVNPINGIQDVSNHHNENQTSVHDAGLINTTTGNVELTYHVVATNGVCQTTGDLVMEVGVTVQPPITINAEELLPIRCPDDRDLILQAEFGGVVNDQTTVTWTFPTIDDRTHTNVVNTTNNKDTLVVTLPNVYNTSYHYTVQFTDGVCTNSDGGDVVVPDKLVMEVETISNVTCYGGNNGSVTILAHGDTTNSSYYYSINGSDFVEKPSGTAYTRMNLFVPEPTRDSTDLLGDTKCGDYSVQIKDERGCTLDTMITICSPAQLAWKDCPSNFVVCCDSGQNYATIIPGVHFPVPTLNTMANVEEITVNKMGNNRYVARTTPHSISYVVEDVCNDWEEVICQFKVRVLPNPTLEPENEELTSQDVCFGNSIQDIQLTFTNATLKDTLLPPGVTLNTTTGLISGTPTEQLTSPKTYNYLIIATSNQSVEGFEGCGSDTLKGSITVYPSPTAQLTYTPDSCAGSRGTITARMTSGTTMPLVRVSFDGGSHGAWLTDNDKIYNQLQAGTHTLTVWSWDGMNEGCSVTETLDLPLYSPYLAPTNFQFSNITYAHNICSGTTFDTLPVAPVFGDYATTYKWEAPTGSVTGGAAATTAQNTVSGGPLSNTTNTVQNAVYTVTPTTGTVCEGPVFTVTVPVNPTVVMNRPASQVVCSDSTIDAVQFSSTITDGSMSYSWSRDNTVNVTGLDDSGTGNISATALKNTTTTVQTVTFTVTPTYTNGGVSCTGDTMKFSIKVNPEVLLSVDNEANLTQTIVYGQPITDVVFSYSEHATLTHTNLPAGVEYNTSTNTLSGTPAAAGNYTVTFTANSTQTPNCGKKEKVVTINVAKAALTVTADDKTKVYGDPDPDLTWTITNGLQNGDTKESLVSTGALVVTISRAQAGTTDGENVGTYAITPAGEATQGNYTVTYVPGNLTITRANVTVKAVANEKNYGETDPTLTATVSGLQNNDAASVIAYTISRTAGEAVGEYAITPAGAAVQGNYNVSYVPSTLTITPANVTVKADAKSKYFGTADPTLTATVTGLQNGDAENAITYTISRAQAGTADGENVGEYVITPTGAATQGNYTVTYDTAKLTINPVDVTVTVTGNTAMLVENGSNQSVEGFTATASNSQYKVSGENPDFRLKANETAVATRSTVGKTYMGLTASKFENVNSNYNVTIQEVTDGWIEIVPTGTVIVNITGHTATTDYDAQEHVVSGYDVVIVNPDPTTTYTKNDFTFTGDSTLAETNAGTYPMGLAENQFTNTNADFANVMFHITDGGLTINKVNATVTVAGNHATHAYDGVEHVIENYVVSNVTPAFYTEDDFTFTPAEGATLVNGVIAAKRTNAGTTYMGLAESQFANTNANFDHVTFQVTDGFQTIEPIAVDVAIKGHTLMHEYTTFEQSVEGFDTITSSTLLKPADIVFSGYAVATGTVPDTYPMGLTTNQFSCGNPNFNVTFTVEDGWLQIVPAGIVIVNITGNTATKDYNCEEQSVSGYTYTIGGVDENNQPYANIYNDPSYFKLNGTALDSTATRTNAGTTYMGLTEQKFQNLNTFFNVEFHVVDGWLTINKVTASMKIKGNTDEVTYDGDPHTVTGYSITDVSPSCYNTQYVQFTGTTADSTATRTDAGTTNMNLVAGLFQNASTNSNFEVVTFTVENGFMKVNPLEEVTVTLHGNTSTVDYDGQSHTVTGYTVDEISSDLYTVNDFSLAEGVEATATRTNVVEDSDADGKTSMGLTPESFVNLNPNFAQVNFVVTDGYQEIKPINATITAIDQTYTYNASAQGENNATYTNASDIAAKVTVTGLLNGETLTSIKLNGQKTNAGEYPSTIVPSEAVISSGSSNYNITYVEGDLTINKATLTITAKDQTYTYNGSAQGPAGTYTADFDTYVTVTGLQGSDALTSITLSGIQTNQGTYTDEIVPSAAAIGSNTDNYNIEYVEGDLTINKATLTITALPKTYTYNGSAQGPAGTYTSGFDTYVTVTGLQGSDALTSLTMAGSQMNVGEYANEIVPSAAAIGNSTGNYNISYNNALLTINKADLTITINNTNKVYDNSPLVVNYNNNNVSISGNAANAHLTAGKVTTNGTAVGIYTYANQTVTITESFAMSDGIANYNVLYDITMEITQSQVVINCPTAQSDTEKVYNGTPISYTVSASTGTGDPVTVEYSTDNTNWSTNKPSRTDVGETQVYVRASADNYATQYCQYKLKVTPLAVTVTVTGNHDTKTYDAAEHTAEGYTATATSQLYKVSGDAPDFALASGQTAVAKRTNEGTTNMGLTTNSFVNNNPNFNVTFLVAADGYMTINKRALTITAKDQTFTYNGAAQGENNATYTDATKVTVEGLQGTDTLTSIKLNGMETNAGVYNNKIEPSAAAIGNATGNYDITYVKGKLTINTVALTITAKNQEYTYNGNVQGPAGTYTSGFDTYVTVSGLQGSDALSSITMAGGKTNVGEYANEIVPSAAAVGNATNNYEISYLNGKLTINKANLTITVKTSKYYDGTVLEANFDDDSVSLSGNMNNASLTAGKVKTNAATVGTYTYAANTVTINPEFAMSDGISNYNVTYNITMEIKNNVVNMTCTDADRVYDATPFSHSIEATVVHGTPTVEYSLDSLNWSTTAPSRTDAGTTKVYVRASADNYETATCSYNLTVNKRYVKITTPGGIFLYDGNPHGNPGNYTISGDGFVDGHAYNFATPAVVTALGTCVTDTITYQTSSEFNESNYTIEYQLGQLCISGNAPIVITSASNAAPIYYDGQLHGTESAYRTYTVTYDGTEMPVIEGSNGLKFRLPAGDTVTITPTFTGVTFFDDANDTSNNNVFTYTITHDDFYVGPRTLNYGTVNITKRPITFTIAPSLASKTYDGDIMTVNATDLTVGGQGLATTDTLTAGIVKTDNFVAGEYTCAVGGFQAGYQGVAIKEGFVIKHSNGHITTSSYNPQFNVKLTIDQKAITVTSDDAEKVYDGTELTNDGFAIMSGELANGDELSAEVTGSQTCVGEGDNTVSSVTVRRSNGSSYTDVTESYNITTVAGTLKVKPITVGFACPQDITVIMKDDDDNVVVTADIIGQASLVPTTPSVLDHITITNNLDERNPMSEGVDTVTWTLRDECGNAMTTCEQLVTVKYKPCETINHMGYDYPTKRIGHQCWFTEDLRYEFGNYTAYNNLTENAEKFGYLYSWYTAMGVPENTTTVAPTIDTADNGSLYVQGICPEGWAVGSMADFHTLELTAGSISSLKDPSTLYWQNGYEGDNPGTRFNARGGGWYNSTRSRYEDIKTGYHFWKADAPSITTLTNSSTVVSLLISYHCDQILEQTSQKSDRRSVRCIRKKINP